MQGGALNRSVSIIPRAELLQSEYRSDLASYLSLSVCLSAVIFSLAITVFINKYFIPKKTLSPFFLPSPRPWPHQTLSPYSSPFFSSLKSLQQRLKLNTTTTAPPTSKISSLEPSSPRRQRAAIPPQVPTTATSPQPPARHSSSRPSLSSPSERCPHV